ncbi:hypothetical protein [Blastococcus haudaquaticus]|uniref:Uncharacterized protein n=1 Tax=Blastococcus haudaquaticus TaxID=1938745 RepID=A0A286GNT6_9ACTN|nr:hypothetical protein [Blastococcus haudaquaticus]SOD97221.1 hypothetical protein SAMN06272739_1376 [Blastococcus haudaquaticus]
MTEPTPPSPVPGPPRPGPRPGEAAAAPGPLAPTQDPAAPAQDPFAGLDERPVAEHVAVYETEHARLERELGTIDQL